MNTKEEILNELHSELTQKLLEKVRDPDCKASDLNVARQFLKDNGIEADPNEDSPLKDLIKELPFKINATASNT